VGGVDLVLGAPAVRGDEACQLEVGAARAAQADVPGAIPPVVHGSLVLRLRTDGDEDRHAPAALRGRQGYLPRDQASVVEDLHPRAREVRGAVGGEEDRRVRQQRDHDGWTGKGRAGAPSRRSGRARSGRTRSGRGRFGDGRSSRGGSGRGWPKGRRFDRGCSDRGRSDRGRSGGGCSGRDGDEPGSHRQRPGPSGAPCPPSAHRACARARVDPGGDPRTVLHARPSIQVGRSVEGPGVMVNHHGRSPPRRMRRTRRGAARCGAARSRVARCGLRGAGERSRTDANAAARAGSPPRRACRARRGRLASSAVASCGMAGPGA